MTPKQKQIILDKIARIKKALAADKKRCGGYYEDSHGLRYLPPELYLQMKDYVGSLKYFKWFEKKFPADIGFPLFLFEWTITLFKTSDFKNAEILALKTFFSNSYLFDKFLDYEFLDLDKYEGSDWQTPELAEYLIYSKHQEELNDFAKWISEFLSSDKFYKIANEFVEIEIKLKTEPVGQMRAKLIARRYHLLDNYA